MRLDELADEVRKRYGDIDDLKEEIRDVTGADSVNLNVSSGKTSVHLTYYNE